MKNEEKNEELFQVGKTYMTKFATQERFTITQDPYHRHKETNLILGLKQQVVGIYESCPELGECPLNNDRLINK